MNEQLTARESASAENEPQTLGLSVKIMRVVQVEIWDEHLPNMGRLTKEQRDRFHYPLPADSPEPPRRKEGAKSGHNRCSPPDVRVRLTLEC